MPSGPRGRSHATPEVGAILRASYETGRAHFADLVREEAVLTGLSEPVVEDYLRHALHYELDQNDIDGLSLFYRLAAEDGLIPAVRPLEFL